MNQTFARIRELEQELAEARQHISDGMHELSAEREQLRQLMDRRDAALDALRQVRAGSPGRRHLLSALHR